MIFMGGYKLVYFIWEINVKQKSRSSARNTFLEKNQGLKSKWKICPHYFLLLGEVFFADFQERIGISRIFGNKRLTDKSICTKVWIRDVARHHISLVSCLIEWWNKIAWISKGRTFLCVLWREDANKTEVRDHKEGWGSRSTTRQLKVHVTWIWIVILQMSEWRIKLSSSIPFLFNLCVICGQILLKLKSLTKFLFLFSFQLFATFHAWMEASVVLEINASALLITLVNSVRFPCRLPILQNSIITRNRWTRL